MIGGWPFPVSSLLLGGPVLSGLLLREQLCTVSVSSRPTWRNDVLFRLTREILLRVLLAGLGWLADLLPNDLPLVVFVLLNSRKESGFLKGGGAKLVHAMIMHEGAGTAGGKYLVFSKLGIVHVLVPVLLDTALCPRGECL